MFLAGPLNYIKFFKIIKPIHENLSFHIFLIYASSCKEWITNEKLHHEDVMVVEWGNGYKKGGITVRKLTEETSGEWERK